MPKISVIIPVYNAEKYIQRCVDSVLIQSFDDFELLLINDGSTDTSGVICDRYATIDSRVRVYHKRNGGVSSARNLGLDNAKGEWVTFVDSDDWILESYLSNLISHIEDVDLVFSYAEILYSDGSRRRESYKSRIVTNEYDVLFTENDLSWHTSPWAKLFKAKLCTKLRFVEGMHMGEDLFFLYSYMLECTRIYVSSDTDYVYCLDSQGSLTKRVNSLNEELLSYHNICNIVKEFIITKGISSAKAKEKLGWIIAYYVRRVLNALYYDGKSRTILSRINIIKALDIDKYTKYIDKPSKRERIYIAMLKYRLYLIYDLTRMSIKRLKR